jgi:membrane protein
LLLDRRISWRRLLPAGALSAACTALYGVASTIYMPALFKSYSARYGLFGVTLALIGWLLCIALIVVASTAVASVLDRADEEWARRIRRGWGLEPPKGRRDDVSAAPGMTTDRRGVASDPVPGTRPPSSRPTGSPTTWPGPRRTPLPPATRPCRSRPPGPPRRRRS